ncbi:hypothetical protein MSG28_004350 [Choristoneura fumiferana]|uniref:Uncharacterized protein n=1 Tax=Choristoneura fumiferana TaxID=7141 RepID=A0ACC0KJC0_CHOFU|nr:hypothetical protein MSG28_004350 [Choristoneura fumiferana]
MAETMEDLGAMLADLSRVSDRVGLKMNMDKTKVMSNVHVVPTPVIVGDSALEVVDDYVYLGQTVQLGRSNFEKEITRRAMERAISILASSRLASPVENQPSEPNLIESKVASPRSRYRSSWRISCATPPRHSCMGDPIHPSSFMVSQNKPNTLKLNSVARQTSRYSARDPRLRP